ncbi:MULTISPECIES: MHYT domain-containing protein [unclassified Nocardia]|uniref:MHYT domain-containing protein n=1 Tax=unclassified Nocardia TaxID=2637762 RepID=UPI001CE3D485|nr:MULTISPECIES: MHYT domain-containing protein [unclassified Nocardia]
MLDVYHFTYGWLTPVLAYTMSVTGSLLGLQCAARARSDEGRVGWLVGAAIAIGGTGIWVMHFIAMLGFTIRGSEIRYNVPLTLLSALTAIIVVGIGLFLVNKPEPTWVSLLAGGAITGLGVAGMHYTGMYAMQTDAMLHYDSAIVGLSVLIAVVAATVALWFTLRVKGFLSTVAAALIMGVAVTGMHYTGMASISARRADHVLPPSGSGAMEVLAPIIVAFSMITILLLISVGLTEIESTMDLPPLKFSRRSEPARRAAETEQPSAEPSWRDAPVPVNAAVHPDDDIEQHRPYASRPRRYTAPPARRPADRSWTESTTTGSWPINSGARH